MRIPAEAVEAAAKVMYTQDVSSNDVGEFNLWVYEHDAREILEAAAPHMPCLDAASVWDEAVNVLYMGNAIGQDHLKAMLERNPYRSQT